MLTAVDLIEDIKRRLVDELQPHIDTAVESKYKNRIARATLSTEEAANYLGVCKATLLTMVQEKQIACFYVGSLGSKKPTPKFRLSVLDQWMEDAERKQLERGE